MEIVIILLIILINAFFALSETALIASKTSKLHGWEMEGKKNAKRALKIAEHPSKYLSTVQLAITLIGALAGTYGGATISEKLRIGLSQIDFLAKLAQPLSIGIVVIALTFISVVVGELIPKNLALLNPEKISIAVIRPMAIFMKIFSPLVQFLANITDWAVRGIAGANQKNAETTEEEIRSLLAQAVATGKIAARSREIVEGALSLGNKQLATIMTPRTELAYVNLSESNQEIQKTVIDNSRFAYLPVFESNPDKVIGLLNVRTCLASLASHQRLDARGHIRNALILPETIPVLQAIASFRKEQVKSALVLDEFGEVAGIVSLSDLMRTVFGELPLTAYEPEPQLIGRADGSYLVDGAFPIDRFIRKLSRGSKDYPRDYRTAAGLVLYLLGKIPKPGDSCEWEGMTLEVVEMSRNRISKIEVRPPRH